MKVYGDFFEAAASDHGPGFYEVGLRGGCVKRGWKGDQWQVEM